MKPYLITIQAVVVTDDTPDENLIDVQLGQDYPKITSTKVEEMVPKSEIPEPVQAVTPEPVQAVTPEPLSAQTARPLPTSDPAEKEPKKIAGGGTRPFRNRDPLWGIALPEDRDGPPCIEFFYSSQGYTSAARRLGVGTFDGEAPTVGVWLTKSERADVWRQHREHLDALKKAKQTSIEEPLQCSTAQLRPWMA